MAVPFLNAVMDGSFLTINRQRCFHHPYHLRGRSLLPAGLAQSTRPQGIEIALLKHARLSRSGRLSCSSLPNIRTSQTPLVLSSHHHQGRNRYAVTYHTTWTVDLYRSISSSLSWLRVTMGSFDFYFHILRLLYEGTASLPRSFL